MGSIHFIQTLENECEKAKHLVLISNNYKCTIKNGLKYQTNKNEKCKVKFKNFDWICQVGQIFF